MLWNFLLSLLADWLLLGSDCESHHLSSSSLLCLDRPCFWHSAGSDSVVSDYTPELLPVYLSNPDSSHLLFYDLFLPVNDGDVWASLSHHLVWICGSQPSAYHLTQLSGVLPSVWHTWWCESRGLGRVYLGRSGETTKCDDEESEEAGN